MRARYPDRGGYLERDGVKVFYEVHGEGHWPTILLMSNAPGAPLRHWKAQIPFLGRHFRVVAFDAPGNGMADRPQSPESYTDEAETGYAVAVMDATGTERAVFVSYDDPSVWSLQLAATHPERVLGIAAITPSVPWLTEGHPHRAVYDFDAKL